MAYTWMTVHRPHPVWESVFRSYSTAPAHAR